MEEIITIKPLKIGEKTTKEILTVLPLKNGEKTTTIDFKKSNESD